MSETPGTLPERGRLSPDLRRPWRTYVPTLALALPPFFRSATPPIISMVAPMNSTATPVIIGSLEAREPLTPGASVQGLRGEFEDEVD